MRRSLPQTHGRVEVYGGKSRQQHDSSPLFMERHSYQVYVRLQYDQLASAEWRDQRLIPHIPHSLAKLAPSVLSHCTRSSHLLIPLCLSRRVYRQNSHHTMYGSSVVPNDMPQSVRGNCCSKNWVTFGRITKGFWCIITTVSLPHSPSHTYPPLSFSSSLPPSLSPFLSAFPTSFLPTS